MLNRIFALIFLFLYPGLFCLAKVKRPGVDSLALNAITDKYAVELRKLAMKADSMKLDTLSSKLNPYHFRLFAPGTLYLSPLQKAFGIRWQSSLPGKAASVPSFLMPGDSVLCAFEEEDHALMQAYVNFPYLMRQTEKQLNKAGDLKEVEGLPKVPSEVKLAEKEMNIDLTPDIDEIDLVVKRPNFWTFRGNYSLQFTQSYFSDNWSQGGEDNYAMLATATMEANFNNKQKIQWENRLEMRLGFQTSKSDEIHKFKTNDDLLRFTTKIGYKATKHWFYTLQVQAYTQFYPSYKANSKDVSSDFMSPFNMVVAPSMDYKLELKRFRSSATFAPLAYSFRYVGREALYRNFGIEEGHNTYHKFGPSITVHYNWDIYKNIHWGGRIYWFSNLEMTSIEWENTFTFTINRYLTTKLFLYPRIDDSSPNYRSKDKGLYLMFKEWFSLGLNYSF